MSTSTAPVAPSAAPTNATAAAGMRVNGKQWHPTKKAFRPTAGQTTYAKRVAKESQRAETKKLEQEMKTEKEAERQRKVQAIKDKRAAKEEKARFELMAAKMHAKRVERLKRREKRNKLLKS
nr:rrna-processing protein cgra [Quercus suber]